MRKRSVFLFLLSMLFASAAIAAPQAKQVEWRIGKQAYSGYLVYDDAVATKRPGLLMVPDWMGVTDSAVAKAKQVAGS